MHPAAADTLSAAVVEALAPRPGDTVLDLYCGAGLFAGAVAPLVGPEGAVTGIESDAAAVKNARQNLSDCPQATVTQGRRGPGRRCRGPAARQARHRRPAAGPGSPARLVAYLIGDGVAGDTPAERFAYVSCDPATLARDLALLIGGGWRLERLRAFDAFPMTHHVECVATLSR